MSGTPNRVECRQCGDRIVAPERSEYVSETGAVRHRWRCSKCGCEFATRVDFDASWQLPPDLAEEFLPNLLVA